MQCPRCRTELSPPADSCPECDAPVGQIRTVVADWTCPSCQADVDPDDPVCGSCGLKVGQLREWLDVTDGGAAPASGAADAGSDDAGTTAPVDADADGPADPLSPGEKEGDGNGIGDVGSSPADPADGPDGGTQPGDPAPPPDDATLEGSGGSADLPPPEGDPGSDSGFEFGGQTDDGLPPESHAGGPDEPRDAPDEPRDAPEPPPGQSGAPAPDQPGDSRGQPTDPPSERPAEPSSDRPADSPPQGPAGPSPGQPAEPQAAPAQEGGAQSGQPTRQARQRQAARDVQSAAAGFFDGLPVARAAGAGVLAYLLNLFLTYGLATTELSNDGAGAATMSKFEVAGWLFYGGHFVGIEGVDVFGTENANYLRLVYSEGFAFHGAGLPQEVFYLVPMVGLYLAGLSCVRYLAPTEDPDPRQAGKIGIPIAAGYGLAALFGAVTLFSVTTEGTTFQPSLPLVVVLMGVVYPVVVGGIGGVVGSQ